MRNQEAGATEKLDSPATETSERKAAQAATETETTSSRPAHVGWNFQPISRGLSSIVLPLGAAPRESALQQKRLVRDRLIFECDMALSTSSRLSFWATPPLLSSHVAASLFSLRVVTLFFCCLRFAGGRRCSIFRRSATGNACRSSRARGSIRADKKRSGCSGAGRSGPVPHAHRTQPRPPEDGHGGGLCCECKVGTAQSLDAQDPPYDSIQFCIGTNLISKETILSRTVDDLV